MALGIYQVDPVTRRVGPYSPVNAGALSRIAARLLTLRGATCARGNDPQKSSRPARSSTPLRRRRRSAGNRAGGGGGDGAGGSGVVAVRRHLREPHPVPTASREARTAQDAKDAVRDL